VINDNLIHRCFGGFQLEALARSSLAYFKQVLTQQQDSGDTRSGYCLQGARGIGGGSEGDAE
jgi:hypothetical protein